MSNAQAFEDGCKAQENKLAIENAVRSLWVYWSADGEDGSSIDWDVLGQLIENVEHAVFGAGD